MTTDVSYVATSGLNPTHTAANKWIGYVPLKNILGDAFPNLELQVTQFYLPSVNVGFVPVSHQGYTIKVPAAGVMNADDKTLKFQYIIDDEWRNYTALHTWSSKFAQYGTTVKSNLSTAQLAALAGKFATVRLWLLSPFKKRIVDFEFHDCWIQSFGEILLDCTSSDPIKHEFTVAYTDYIIHPALSTSGNRTSEKQILLR